MSTSALKTVRLTPSAELWSFVVIGLLCTGAYAIAYTLMRHAGLEPMAANALSLTLTMGANFAANRRFSFRASDRPLGRQLATYTVAYLLGLAASAVALAGLLAALGHPEGALDTSAGVAAGLAATVVRYALMRNWVFGSRVSAIQGTVASPRLEPFERISSRVRSIRLPRPELLGLIVLSALLYLWSLSRNGWANDYYSAAVRSMSSSWHNFLYGSFDPSGLMTVDKPPLALWVQALSVRVFGYHPLSVLVPQTLMGVGAVVLIYDLTRRRFGRLAGAIAGLVLALTPITVAISRHNNPDALLVLCSVAALWFLVRGLEDGRTRWLVLSGVAVGLGFETKMAVALMVLPAIAAAWIWVAPRGRMRALRQLAAGGAAMAVVGLAWPLLVALTPASSRPWISGTSDNSIWSLILGYNGLGRIDGQAGGPGAIGGGGGAGGNFGGSPGLLRLLNQSVGGQAGWLLGFAVVAGVAVVLSSKLARSDRRSGWLIAVGGSFLTTAVAFSVAQGIFHPYYVSLLAPFTAALVGAGVVELRHANAPHLLAPLAVAAGVTTELIVLGNQPGDLTWWRPLLVAGGVVAIAGLVASFNGRVRSAALATGVAVLLIAPAIWSVQTLGHPTNGTFPAGGPVTAAAFGGPGGGGGRAGGGFPGQAAACRAAARRAARAGTSPAPAVRVADSPARAAVVPAFPAPVAQCSAETPT